MPYPFSYRGGYDPVRTAFYLASQDALCLAGVIGMAVWMVRRRRAHLGR